MKFLGVFGVLFLIAGLSYGQPQQPLPVQQSPKKIIVKDTTQNVKVRKFDEEAIANYRKQKAFDYGEKVAPTQSWWERFLEWIGSLFPKSTGIGKPNGMVVKILIAVLAAVIIFAIVKITKLDLLIFAKKSKKLDLNEDEAFEDIHQIQFDDQIALALQNQNYRLAVRLLYLGTLKALSDNGLIDWQLDKTNQHYISELSDSDRQAIFKQLTTQFEYVWYGDFQIGASQYETINTNFVQFNQFLK